MEWVLIISLVFGGWQTHKAHKYEKKYDGEKVEKQYAQDQLEEAEQANKTNERTIDDFEQANKTCVDILARERSQQVEFRKTNEQNAAHITELEKQLDSSEWASRRVPPGLEF